jgi:hypothetical protein
VNLTGVGSSLLRNEQFAVGFEYPAFLVKVNFFRWVAAYLIGGAALITLQATVGHEQWNVWSYGIFGYIFLWTILSVHGFWKGWLKIR